MTGKAVTQVTVRQFGECPKCKCKRNELDAQHWENSGSTWVWRKVICRKCAFSYNEVYVFVQNETCDSCKPIDENGDVITHKGDEIIILEPAP